MEIRLLSPPNPGYTASGMLGDVRRADQEPGDRGRFVIRWQERACSRGRTVQVGRPKFPRSPDPSPPAHATTPPRNQISYQSLAALRATRRVCKSGAYSLRGSGQAAFIPPHFQSSPSRPFGPPEEYVNQGLTAYEVLDRQRSYRPIFRAVIASGVPARCRGKTPNPGQGPPFAPNRATLAIKA